MNNETYEQVQVAASMLNDAIPFLKEGNTVTVQMRESQPIGIELPTFVDLKIVETAPGLKGDTVSGGTKPATLETGLVIQVPPFINEGELIRVDTNDGKYLERVKA